MPLNDAEKIWYRKQIRKLDPKAEIVSIDTGLGSVTYSSKIRSDESHSKPLTPEEWVHALLCVMLVQELGYPIDRLVHERHIAHGSAGSYSDEMDILVLDEDGRPYAAWEVKSSEAYSSQLEAATKFQLFGTVPLLTEGAPTFIVCATISPDGKTPQITHRCIDYREHRDYQAWVDGGKLCVPSFPREYWEPDYQPYIRGGERDLRTNCTQLEFKAIATSFHNEFFSEHPDNQLFEDLVKCLLAKIYSEKNTDNEVAYEFQILLPQGKPEKSAQVFDRINGLYSLAFRHYIDPAGTDEIDPRRFSAERVKSVVQQLEGLSLTKGAALNADIIGAFFEEILRSGFKQDRGMYFTHDNIVRFMIEAVDVRGLTRQKWRKATHPENRLPYIIDPASGSGTFLLHAMYAVTDEVLSNRKFFAKKGSDEDFLSQNFSESSPNGWAKDFLYGFDPKFIMAMTAKLNMVLHGDGVAHLFKEDAYRSMDQYQDARLRPAGAKNRSLPESRYRPAMCETFDVVVSNPPFSVKLAPEIRNNVTRSFSLGENSSTEALFIERAFQLLKPNGRLAVVLPESILNAVDSELRLFLMRMFYIRAIVALPRHIFVDTPTLTSLLFAQKKTSKEIVDWDNAWSEGAAELEERVASARRCLTTANLKTYKDVQSLEHDFLKCIAPIADRNTWILKRGRGGSEVLNFAISGRAIDVETGADHYRNILKSSGFEDIFRKAVFSLVAEKLPSEWSCYAAEEIGFKLSRRGERIRENQLIRFVGKESGRETPNLHVSLEGAEVVINDETPTTVLDFMSIDVNWR